MLDSHVTYVTHVFRSVIYLERCKISIINVLICIVDKFKPISKEMKH